VTLLDANILLYAANRAAPEHEIAREWLDRQLSGTARVGLPWPSLLAFVRLATNPLVLSQPASPGQAWDQVEEWLGADAAWIPTPGEHHRDVVAGYCRASWMTARLVPDAHLAALAVEHGLRLCSSDADFARVPGLDWFNPLAV
jgi:toxin-antitoxin system PIN domain toxin